MVHLEQEQNAHDAVVASSPSLFFHELIVIIEGIGSRAERYWTDRFDDIGQKLSAFEFL